MKERRERNLCIVRLLILLAFIFIFSGYSFYVDDQSYFSGASVPKTSETIPENSVSITTTDEVILDDTSGEEAIPSDQNTTSSPSPSPSPSSAPTAPSTTPSNPTPTQPSTPEATTPSNPVVTVEQTNQALREQLQQQYSITIRYGSETSGYSVGGLSTIALTDPYAIQSALSSLSANISLYPSQFFQEIRSSGYSLTIYLIKRYSTNNVTGVTDSSTKNVVISIATDYPFAESFNHEVFHYIDNYIYFRGGRYTTWNNLNPLGYQYGNVNSSLSYTTTRLSDAYFVNNYAQTDEYEDRASTFEYMMASSKISCFSVGRPIWLKAKYISEQLDLFFDSVRPDVTEYWERYVY